MYARGWGTPVKASDFLLHDFHVPSSGSKAPLAQEMTQLPTITYSFLTLQTTQLQNSSRAEAIFFFLNHPGSPNFNGSIQSRWKMCGA